VREHRAVVLADALPLCAIVGVHVSHCRNIGIRQPPGP
jgi:hypothetical protein